MARKHCGAKREFKIGLEFLQKKCGSLANAREFKRMVKAIASADEIHDHFPDYAIRVDEDEMVFFTNKAALKTPAPVSLTQLGPDVYQDAREIAKGWDIYVIEQEWRNWMAFGDMEPPTNPERAFLGFCRKWVERNGAA